MTVLIDVLLINPKSWPVLPAYIPNGLLYIASVLRENGFEVKVYDKNTDTRDICEIYNLYDPKIIGVSVLTGKVILDAIEVSKSIKSISDEIPIVWGGLHPTLFPRYVLNEKYVDYIVMGEGEYPMTELSEFLLKSKGSLQNIRNVGYKVNGSLKFSEQRKFIDLEKLPMPAWDLIEMEKYYLIRFYTKRAVNLSTSRGCPHRCTFCYNVVVNKRRWRGMSAEKILDQVNFLKSKYKVTGFFFHEDNFDANKKRTIKFCNLLMKEKMDLKWEHQSRVEYANREQLALEKEAGCEILDYGVESGSDRILKFVEKDITVSEIKAAFKLCYELKIATNANAIVGYPTETLDELKQTIKLLDSLSAYNIFTTIFNPYPGSKLFNYVVQKGLFTLPEKLEDQGKIYDVDDVDLNTSGIPNNILQDILDKYYNYNMINHVKMHMKYKNFTGLYRGIRSRLREYVNMKRGTPNARKRVPIGT